VEVNPRERRRMPRIKTGTIFLMKVIKPPEKIYPKDEIGELGGKLISGPEPVDLMTDS
jgi:hypothetical protein